MTLETMAVTKMVTWLDTPSTTQSQQFNEYVNSLTTILKKKAVAELISIHLSPLGVLGA